MLKTKLLYLRKIAAYIAVLNGYLLLLIGLCGLSLFSLHAVFFEYDNILGILGVFGALIAGVLWQILAFVFKVRKCRHDVRNLQQDP